MYHKCTLYVCYAPTMALADTATAAVLHTSPPRVQPSLAMRTSSSPAWCSCSPAWMNTWTLWNRCPLSKVAFCPPSIHHSAHHAPSLSPTTPTTTTPTTLHCTLPPPPGTRSQRLQVAPRPGALYTAALWNLGIIHAHWAGLSGDTFRYWLSI